MSLRQSLAASLPRAFARLRDLVAWVTATRERRRIIGQLSGLDDHMLRDIGVTRQDVLSVLAEPIFQDPSVKLAERAREARRASRAARLDGRAFTRGFESSRAA